MNKSCEMDNNLSIQIVQRHVDWDQINWSRIKQKVDKFQQNIFRDAQAGNFHKVKQQQKLLVRSLSARLWAVHLTTEKSKGRNTPGIDNRLYKTAEQKEFLVENLSIKNYRPIPTKNIWIPKTDGTRRKLGIPTIKDRTTQSLVLLAMEPEWEAKFEPNSFGFRPGRSAIDAVSHIWYALIHRKDKIPHPGWILDADISKCFDNINHDSLLAKIGDNPFKEIIQKWLNSGTISSIGFERTQRGTPQGGPLSPLLANIALDGLERQFGIYSRFGRYINPAARCGKNKRISLYRYADDCATRSSIIEYRWYSHN